ncbi:hypothetical protein GCM10010207_86410 [Streptomyces atratus]|uniref:hypothetical protein n=1 Tax=Streptomyces atratus TaxID=1893 RepID=UPI0019AE035F|nr:hypothetical protein [Streptomyces atratus]GGT76246.1 hypothetical protein GCM10010207_86410 [Streptomyces atratus]
MPPTRPRSRRRGPRAEPGRDLEGWRSYTPARPKRRTGWYVVGLLASLVLLVVALTPGRIVNLFAGDDPDSPPLAAETARPTRSPAAVRAATQRTR